MIKNILTFILILLSTDAAAVDSSVKIAIVDVQTILDNSLAMRSIKSAVDDIGEEFQKEFSEKETELKTEEQRILNLRSKLTDEEFGKEVFKFNKKSTNLQKELREKKLKLEQAHAKAVSTVNEIALKIISDISQEEDYFVVLPSSQVLFARESLNITKTVLKRLDNKIPSISLKF